MSALEPIPDAQKCHYPDNSTAAFGQKRSLIIPVSRFILLCRLKGLYCCFKENNLTSEVRQLSI